MDDQQLRQEVKWLGVQLGDVLKQIAGQNAFELVEDVRTLARDRREGNADAERLLLQRIGSLDVKQSIALARALSIFFDLANLAEDRHRVRVLRERERELHPNPRPESIGAAVAELKRSGVPGETVIAMLNRMTIELVFTAHPTEAKRKSLREKIRDLRDHLYALDHTDLLPRERKELEREVRSDLTALWQTDFLRERRPTVLEEVDRGLFFFSTLWNVIPALLEEMEFALRTYYPEQWHGHADVPPFVRFGSWIGGDRDGHPDVTTDVTAETLRRLRRTVLQHHYTECRRLRRGLSISNRKAIVSDELTMALAEARQRWPHVEALLKPIAPPESYRLYLRIMQWRIEQTQSAELFSDLPDGAYARSRELLADLEMIRRSLLAQPGGDLLCQPLDRWIRQTQTFGFHAMKLDVRQESSWYHRVLGEVLQAIGATSEYASLDEPARQEVLTRTLPSEGGSVELDTTGLSTETRETLDLFRLLAEIASLSGPEALGAHVISMTHHASDVLAVLWLSRWAAAQVERRSDEATREPIVNAANPAPAASSMPIAPLFETIDDLKRSPHVLNEMLAHPAYASHLKEHDNQQIIMIGYSDSTKDGGYVAACWNLFQAQTELHRQATQGGVKPMFFHGRGGSLGRGGGPAARGILSLPRNTVDGLIRMTEQGEVLTARYDDPHVALRHLEQVTWATVLVSARNVDQPRSEWIDCMQDLADRALRSYRELVEQPGFIDYFQHATPIEEIESLPIGSRPARRSAQRTLATLRAIPWVFSWTQNRHIIPAWYGLGSAVSGHVKSSDDAILRTMYERWPFFRGLIDNAEMALAKTDLEIGRHYAELFEDRVPVPEQAQRGSETIWSLIRAEFKRSVEGVLRITERGEILESVPWLKRSIAVRNPYVDPLNLIQVEHFRRMRKHRDQWNESELERTRELLRLTIQGIAAGLRTTG